MSVSSFGPFSPTALSVVGVSDDALCQLALYLLVGHSSRAHMPLRSQLVDVDDGWAEVAERNALTPQSRRRTALAVVLAVTEALQQIGEVLIQVCRA